MRVLAAASPELEFSEAPTVTQFLHVAGAPTEPGPSVPELPAAKRMSMSSRRAMNSSPPRVGIVYALMFAPLEREHGCAHGERGAR